MSVTLPRDLSGREPGFLEYVGLDARDLCAEFVGQIVADAQAAAVLDSRDQPAPSVDWDEIWRAGEGAPSEEVAIGRIVRAASEVARRISPPGPQTGTDPSSIGREPDPGATEPHRSQEQSAVAPALLVGTGEPRERRADPFTPTRDAPNAVIVPVAAQVQPETLEPPEPQSIVDFEPSPVAGEPDSTPVEPAVALSDQGAAHLVTKAATTTVDQPELDTTLPVTVPIEPQPRPEPETQGAEAARSIRTSRRQAGWVTAFTWTRNLGVVILLFVAWQLWGTAIAQHHAQSQLHDEFVAKVRSHRPPAAAGSGHTLIPASTRYAAPASGTVIAQLQIPSIGVNQYVVEGTSEDNLSQGPGHYTGTALPGQAGNVAIAGHRTTHGAPFNRLGDLVKGDRIILTTTWGERLTYIVTGTPQAVSPSDVSVLNYYGDSRITLTTCTPEFSAAQRLIAVGQLQAQGNGPAVPPAKHVSYHVVNAASNSWDWSLLPGIGIIACLLLLLGLSYRHFTHWFGRVGRWLVLIPLWAAGLYLLFATLTSFLPSDF